MSNSRGVLLLKKIVSFRKIEVLENGNLPKLIQVEYSISPLEELKNNNNNSKRKQKRFLS